MTKANVGRAIGAVLASYLAIAISISVTERLLSLLAQNHRDGLPLSYFVEDLIGQILYISVAGYLCHLIARGQSIALKGLIGVGLSVGTFSLVSSWNAEAHWYAIALLVTYVPCVGIGWALRSHQKAKCGRDGDTVRVAGEQLR